MKAINLDKLQPDPLAAALASSNKETVTISGYICAVDEKTVSMSKTHDGASYIEYPRSAVIASFTEEETGQVTLLVDAGARVRVISAMQVKAFFARTRGQEGIGCGATCKSLDGTATCCCGVGERCKSLTTSCFCESASRPFFPTDMRSIALLQQTGTPEPSFVGNTSFRMGDRPPATLNWWCRTKEGVCPIICYPIIVDDRVVDYFCYCDCTHPVPDKPNKIIR